MPKFLYEDTKEVQLGGDGKYHLFYVVLNKINNKIYFGKHSTEALDDGYYGSGKAISSAIKKYSKINFRRVNLAFFDSEELAYEFEELAVCELMALREDTYNLTLGGKGAAKGSLNPFSKIKQKSEAHKKKLSEAHKGKVLSDETKKKISESKTGKPGHKHSEESKNKIGAGNRGKTRSQEIKDAASKRRTGSKASQEAKKKMSESRTGKKASEEFKIKMRAKRWWNNGKENKRSETSPGPEWVLGRVFRRSYEETSN